MEKNNVVKIQTVRFYLGVLCMLLPAVFTIYSYLMNDNVKDSISAYYYTDLRNFFVGLLLSMATFLVLYQGENKSFEGKISRIAALSAVLVAFLPFDGKLLIQSKLGEFEKHIRIIHFISAGVFLCALATISIFYFKNQDPEDPEGNPKKTRKFIYIFSGIGIYILVLWMFIKVKILEENSPYPSNIFIEESVCLYFLGLSFLLKGRIFRNK